MEGMPFQPVLLQQGWAPFDWAQPPRGDAQAQAYFGYYGIDFEQRQPQLEHGFGYVDAAGFRIAVHSWRPPSARGTVWVVHGYFDHVGLYRHVIGALLAAGWAVVAFDLPGHGLSSGARAVITDFDLYQQVLNHCLAGAAGHFPGPWHAVGQSTGGAILMQRLLAPDDPFDQVVLLAPLVRPLGYRTASWLHRLVGPFRRFIRRVFTANSNDPEFLHFLAELDPLQPRAISVQWFGALRRWVPRFEALTPVARPLWLVQGDMDDTVDWRYNLAMVETKFPALKVVMLEGARHQLANESERYRARIRQVFHDAFA
ncbi:alpha/beta hydrolase [Isoalcanivorax beigongshangi]|uniref:Alpha/beta hydrolase n=1 Tax=Isoalcanivorax beigongshangi TaxID=3238810 RepID=A0ABV4ALE6_9GAMM